jgi:hypothetical protein
MAAVETHEDELRRADRGGLAAHVALEVVRRQRLRWSILIAVAAVPRGGSPRRAQTACPAIFQQGLEEHAVPDYSFNGF